jgi:glycosyltransferase involved in cell wall biosynthesis
MAGYRAAKMPDNPRPMRVAIDTRIPPGQWGGVQQVGAGLATGLSQLDGADEYLFLGYADAAGWLDPLLGGPCRRVEVSSSFGRSIRRRSYDALAKHVPAVARAAGSFGSLLGGLSTPIPASDGMLESLGVDAVHFVTPQALRTAIPSIYQPLDLLHVHLPETFSSLHREYRERAYRAFTEQAAVVVSMTQWGRSDLAGHFGLPPTRIAVVPLPPVIAPTAVNTIDRPSSALPMLPDRFLLYPAQTWPHKNHLRLLDALALLRDRGSDVHVVFTGRRTEHFSKIEARIAQLKLEDRAQFLGYLEEADLAALYRRAVGLIFPSRFEGWGLPVVEAFAWGVPVACADIPVLREVAGDAALYFNPDDSAAIADAVARLWADLKLRDSLRRLGRERVASLSWDVTAKTYRALYRLSARVDLTDEDRFLLRPPTLVA